jgi:hypothetical protein
MSGLARGKRRHEQENRTETEERHKCVDLIHSSIEDACSSWCLGVKKSTGIGIWELCRNAAVFIYYGCSRTIGIPAITM